MPYWLAALSGLLTAFAFPKFSLFFLAWVCLVPLLTALLKKRPSRAFLLGFTAGFVYYAALLYWIPSVPAHYGNLPPLLSFLIYLVLVGLMALTWAVFAFFFSKISLSFPRAALLLSPFIWVSLEYTATYMFTGFPWGLLGYSQVRNLAFLQLASLAGVYGLSFVIVLLQSLFVLSMASKRRSPFFLALLFVLLVHLGGYIILQNSVPRQGAFRAAVLQGNVSSDIYWDRISNEEIFGYFRRHLELSRQAAREGARLIIWPEFSVPLCFSCSQPMYQEFRERLIAFVKETNCTLLLGTNETDLAGGEARYYNAALCLHPDLSMSEYYKMHLVPFGEYTPYKKVFSFIEKVTHAVGDVTPGRHYILHRFEGTRFGSPICYEIIFPNLVRKFAQRGAHFLVTITNDGWYGKSSAPLQHFLIAVFRAVENRRFLLRAATTGISGIVDPYGRVLARSKLLTQTFLTGDVTPIAEASVYTRFGDILPLSGLTLTAVSFILAVIKKRHERKKSLYGRKIL